MGVETNSLAREGAGQRETRMDSKKKTRQIQMINLGWKPNGGESNRTVSSGREQTSPKSVLKKFSKNANKSVISQNWHIRTHS